jgi:hypothetical protein
VLRRAVVTLAVCALLAGCSGKAGPSALDRSICRQVRELPASQTVRVSTPSSVSEHVTVGAVPNSFIAQLKSSPDQVFQGLGRSMTDEWLTQLRRHCSALGL